MDPTDPILRGVGVAALGEPNGDGCVIGDPCPEIVIEGEEHLLIVGDAHVNFVKSGCDTDEKDTFFLEGCLGGQTKDEGRNCNVYTVPSSRAEF